MRLIDADKLKIFLEKYLHYGHAVPWVDAQPTAYDVDKVVDELEKASCSARPVGWSSEKEIVELKTAIDIVKEGGKTER